MAMLEIQFNAFEALLFGALALVLAVGIANRIIKAEFRRKKCVFCGDSIPADEHAHHLEICGLKKLGRANPDHTGCRIPDSEAIALTRRPPA